jgi:dienelactone hydrolase
MASTEPLFLSCSDIDHTFDTESRRRALDILRKDGKMHQLQLFSGVEHGFALRGNPDDPHESEFPLLER